MRSTRSEVLQHGMVAGVLGYAAVVLFYAALNLLQGRSPLFTAALLGEVAFYGRRDATDVVVRAGPALAFNGLHLVVFLIVGTVAASLATQSERGTHFWYIGLSLFIYGAIHVLGLVLWLAAPFRDQLPIWSALAATVAALVGMSLYLLRVHPQLQREWREYEEDA